MAGFCANCGGQINDGDRVCGNCGTPVGGMVPVQGGVPMDGRGPVQGGYQRAPKMPKINGANIKMNKNKIIGISVVGAVVLALIVVLVLIFGGGGYKKAIKKAVKCIENEDVDGMMDITSHLLVDYMDDRDRDLDDRYEYLAEDMLDEMEDACGNIKSVGFEIVDAEVIPERQFKRTLEDLEDDYDLDIDDVKQIVDVEVNISCKGERKTKDVFKGYHFFCVKEDGGWKVIIGGGYSSITSAIGYYY